MYLIKKCLTEQDQNSCSDCKRSICYIASRNDDDAQKVNSNETFVAWMVEKRKRITTKSVG